MAEFLEIKSTHSLVAKHVAKELWDKLFGHETATSGFTLAKAIACAVQFDDQHCGIYAGDVDSYMDFASVFDFIIQECDWISEIKLVEHCLVKVRLVAVLVRLQGNRAVLKEAILK